MMAPARAHRLNQWTEKMITIESSCLQSFDTFVHYIPFFFQIYHLFLEELQRDTANHLISLLSPSLHEHGAQLLASKFKKRISDVHEILQVNKQTEKQKNKIIKNI